MSVPKHDIDKLWSMDPLQFNEWRRKNDLPILFEFFSQKLPKFEEWLEQYGISSEMFLSAPNTGDWFAGNRKLFFEEYVEDGKARSTIRDYKLNLSAFKQRFPDVPFEINNSIEFVPYLSWAKARLKKDKFIVQDRMNGTLTDNFVYNMIKAPDSPEYSRSLLFQEFEVLKLGGHNVSSSVQMGGRNLDFVDLDHLTITGDYHGPSATRINYSTCRHWSINSAALHHLSFYECNIEKPIIRDSRLQNIEFSNSTIYEPRFENSFLIDIMFYHSRLGLPIFYRSEIIKLHYKPLLNKKYFKSVAENCRRFRSAFQNIGKRHEAQKYYYLERIYERKAMYHVLDTYRSEFPKKPQKGNLLELIKTLRAKKGSIKNIAKHLIQINSYRLKIFVLPKYSLKYIKYKCAHHFSLLEDLFWGYGEKPIRIIFNVIIVVLIFSLIYYFTGPTEVKGSIGDSTYFSLVTFTTLGYGDIQPIGTALRLTCGLQALMGLVFMGMIIAGFVNKSKY